MLVAGGRRPHGEAPPGTATSPVCSIAIAVQSAYKEAARWGQQVWEEARQEPRGKGKSN